MTNDHRNPPDRSASTCDRRRCWSETWWPRGVSGDQETSAQLRSVEIEELVVALGPPTRSQVGTQSVHPPLPGGRADGVPDRDPATDVVVQVRFGPAPVGLEEA